MPQLLRDRSGAAILNQKIRCQTKAQPIERTHRRDDEPQRGGDHRHVAELQYGFETFERYRNDEWIGDMVREKLVHVPVVTREDYALMGRIPDLVTSGKLAEVTGLPQLNPAQDRAMLCGSPAMLADCKKLLEDLGFNEGSASRPAEFVIERAFVEK